MIRQTERKEAPFMSRRKIQAYLISTLYKREEKTIDYKDYKF